MTKFITRFSVRMPLGANAMTQKGNVVLYLDKELVDKSKELSFNLSRTFENHLTQLISQLSNNQSTQNGVPTENKINWWAGPDSDRRPSARQADVLTRLDDRPTLCIFFYAPFLYRFFDFGGASFKITFVS
jgi:hypothetical protein